MAATVPLKKSPYMKEWMAQANPPKEATTIKKMNDLSLLLSSNKMTHYFQGRTTEKIMSLQKFDASNRSS